MLLVRRPLHLNGMPRAPALLLRNCTGSEALLIQGLGPTPRCFLGKCRSVWHIAGPPKCWVSEQKESSHSLEIVKFWQGFRTVSLIRFPVTVLSVSSLKPNLKRWPPDSVSSCPTPCSTCHTRTLTLLGAPTQSQAYRWRLHCRGNGKCAYTASWAVPSQKIAFALFKRLDLFSVCLNLPILNFSYKWNHATCSLLSLASFA